MYFHFYVAGCGLVGLQELPLNSDRTSLKGNQVKLKKNKKQNHYTILPAEEFSAL
jgi:hypothetical protein